MAKTTLSTVKALLVDSNLCMAPCQVVNLGKDLRSSWTNPPSAQALLSDRVALQSVLLRHVTRGALHSADFPPGPTPLVTGAGERVTVTAFPNQVQRTQ